MIHNLKFWTGLVLCTFISLTASGGNCPELVKARQFYSEKPFLELNFLQLTHSELFESVDSIPGSLVAGWGGHFRLTMPQQQITSNGTLYWSYSTENKQVLIDSVARMGKWNPLSLLYDPDRLYTCRSQKKYKGGFEFEMISMDSLTRPRIFTLKITDNLAPAAVEYVDENDSKVEVRITKFTRKTSLPDTLFEFVAPPGVESVRMP